MVGEPSTVVVVQTFRKSNWAEDLTVDQMRRIVAIIEEES